MTNENVLCVGVNLRRNINDNHVLSSMIIACLQIGYISSFLVTFYSIISGFEIPCKICTFDFEECILIYQKKLD